MVIQNTERLHRLAKEHCQQALANLVQVPPRITDEGQEGPAWDPVLRRWTYSADFKAWRFFDHLEMKFDKNGAVRSFRDAKRMLPQGELSAVPDPEEFTDKALLAICATAGLMEAGSIISDRSALGPFLLAVEVEQSSTPQRTSYVVHLVTRKLAALEVED